MTMLFQHTIITAKINSAATTNAQVVKASPARLMSVAANNINAAARFLKLYDKATAPTLGTDVPVLTIPIPAGGIVSMSLGAVGVDFSAGLSIAITALGTDADTTAVAANEIKAVIACV
jgi:hypothetical protein